MYTKVDRSRTGLPTITEQGGGMSNTGGAIIVCGEHGERLTPLFVPKGYSNGDHAIFVAKVGMHLVESGHDRRGEVVGAHRIIAIGTIDDPDGLEFETVGEWENGDGNIPEFLKAAQVASSEKAHCYHCREPHFIKREE